MKTGVSVNLDVDGEPVTLAPDEVLVQTQAREGLAVHSEGGVTVALDTELTPALLSEGLARELVRRVQTLRKEADFDLEGFEHKPEYDEHTGIAASYLESKYKQRVQINGMGVYSFEKGERILTEISRKYNEDILIQKTTDAGIEHIGRGFEVDVSQVKGVDLVAPGGKGSCFG